MNIKVYASILFFFSIIFLVACKQAENNTKINMQKFNAEQYPYYDGNDLGLTYTEIMSEFRLWAPTAQEVRVVFYIIPTGGTAITRMSMTPQKQGVWLLRVPENLEGKYYTYQVKINDQWLQETPDLYSKAVGINGERSYILGKEKINPPNWEFDKGIRLDNYTDAIIYELHIRDFSIHPKSGMDYKGRFLAFTEENTSTENDYATGIAHLKEMGVTHVHILPFFDYRSLDESKFTQAQYNWGYDPLNYNVPEGTYATNPAEPSTRIWELKRLIQSLHNNGIGVIMDVVYNHAGLTENSYFQRLVPYYYYRQNENGGFSNASSCGNELATERPMVRKYIIESVLNWVNNYHIDGFRFDLMGIHDIAGMNAIRDEIDKTDPRIMLYGEGWTAGNSPLADSLRAIKQNTPQLNRIAVFSDEIRDGLKGHVFTPTAKGFVSGNDTLAESVKFGIVGAINHTQINYQAVNYTDAPYANSPQQTIVYASCHDNHTLWDKLSIANPNATEAERKKMHCLAQSIVLTSQGIAFLHAGTEILRSKQGVENSFESPDSINQIDWTKKEKYYDVFTYIKSLIALRKAHPAFRMPTAAMVNKHLSFLPSDNKLIIAYQISDYANNDSWKDIIVIFNANNAEATLNIPENRWTVVAKNNTINEQGIATFMDSEIQVPPISTTILVSASSVRR